MVLIKAVGMEDSTTPLRPRVEVCTMVLELRVPDIILRIIRVPIKGIMDTILNLAERGRIILVTIQGILLATMQQEVVRTGMRDVIRVMDMGEAGPELELGILWSCRHFLTLFDRSWVGSLF